MAVIEVTVAHFLAFVQQDSHNPKGAAASNTLVLTHQAKVSPFSVSIAQTIQFGHTAECRTSIKNISVAQDFHMEPYGYKGPAYHHIDFFFMWQEARKVLFEQISQSFVLTDLADGVASKLATNTLVFTQTATGLMVRNKTIAHTLSLQSFGSAYKIPFYGSPADVILTGEVTILTPGQITLTFQGYTIALRDPDFGDARGIEHTRINRKNRGGEIYMYRDPLWPKNRTLRFSFSYLSEAQRYAFQHFNDVSLGKEIVLVDYEGRSWTGLIRTPEVNIQQQGRFNHTLDFEFEGIMTP